MKKHRHFTFLEKRGFNLNLGTIKELSEFIGNPHKDLKCIHVAGTNGKGSVTAFISSILIEAGFRVGTFISPHLVEENERFLINGKPIADKKLLPLIERIRFSLKGKKIKPSLFEFCTALAFLFFKEEKVDFAVLETGMGGRLDATNIVDSLISVITKISFDHQEYLGNSIEEIAAEKAGIIKENSVCITRNKGKALNVIKKFCKKKKAKLIVSESKAELKKIDVNKMFFDLTFEGKKFENVCTSLIGEHQLENIENSVNAVLELRKKGFGISEKDIINGIKKTHWPLRLELKQKKPFVFLDASHNEDGLKKTGLVLRELFPKKKFHFYFSLSGARDYRKMLQVLIPFASRIDVFEGKFKPVSGKEMQKFLLKKTKKINSVFYENPRNGLRKIIENSEKDDVIVALGSIYGVSLLIENW